VTITIDLDTEAVVWAEPQLVIDVGTTPNGGGDWTAFVTDRDGTVIESLGRVKIGDIDRPLAEKPTVTITVPKSWPAIAELKVWEREVQVFRGGDLRFCGPVQQRSGSSSKGEVLVRCAGVAAYLEKRLYPVVPWRRNWILNPRFDDDLDRWTYGGPVVVDTEHETGSQSALLTGSAFIEQSPNLMFSVDVTAVIDVRVKLSESTPDGAGLWVEVPGVDTGDGWGAARITSSTPRGEWTTLRVVLFIKGRSAGRMVVVRFSTTDADDGVWVDRASLTVLPPDIIRSEIDEIDQVDRYISLSELIRATNVDLNIGVDSLAGINVPFNGWHDRYVDEIIALMTATGDTDVDVVCTPRTRTVRSWSPRGVTHDPEDLTLRNTPGVGTDLARGNVASFDWDEDGGQARTAMTTVGDDGYRGTYQDSDLLGGLLLEDVQTAPPGTPLEDLEALSQRAVAESEGLLKPITATTCDPALYAIIDLGDVVEVDLVDEGITFTGPHRIINIVEKTGTDNMVLTLAPVPA